MDIKMNKKLLLALSLTTALNAQNLEVCVMEVLSTNPVVIERLKNYNATKQDIDIAKAGYYPKLDLSLGIGYEHTTKDNAATKAGANDKFEYTVYQNSLTYTQNIFNGFSTHYQINNEKMRSIAAAYNYVEKANAIAFEMVDNYLQVLKHKELLDNEKENVEINKEIFEKVQKLYDSGLTTLSEVNKIESSLSLAKSNYVVQENTLLDYTYHLHKVLGRYLDYDKMQKPTQELIIPETIEEATQISMQNNPSLLVSKYNVKLAQSVYKESKSTFYPKLDIELSQTLNKNLSAVEGQDDRSRAMLFLSYNFFNGFADSSSIQRNISNIHKEVQLKNTLRRDVIEGLNLSWAAKEKLSEQLVHLEKYKDYADKTLSLYKKEYDLGRRSLLDLLSAQGDFIGSKTQIISAKYNMLFAKYRILDAMGTLVSTMVDNELMNSVGLNNSGITTENDKLPIAYDSDKDLIVDERDICNNSVFNDMRSIYGCHFNYKDTKLIERYSQFLFESSKLTDAGKDRLQKLIKQLKPYGFDYLKFDVLGNVDNKSMTEPQLIELSKLRAEVVKYILIEAGAKEENIVIHSNADKAPMYSDEYSDSIELNNRVDIIVRKLKK